MNQIRFDHLSAAYGKRIVLEDACCDIVPGSLNAIVGPNGAGKSTLLKSAIGIIPKLTGDFLLDGEAYIAGKHAIGYLPQRESVDWDFPVTVFDVVLMGTYRRVGWLKRPGKAERAIAAEAIHHVGLTGLESRQIGELSGGQQQRVFLARALAQQSDLYLMDEPFAGVDAATEEAIYEVLRELQASGKTVIAVHHDLETVRERFDNVLLLNRTVLHYGPVETTLTPENLEQTYGHRRTA